MLKKLTVKVTEEAKDDITPEKITEIITDMGKECEFEYSEMLGLQDKAKNISRKKTFSESGSKKFQQGFSFSKVG